MGFPKEALARAWADHLADATGQAVYAMRREGRAEPPFTVVVVKRLFPVAPGENTHRAEVRVVHVSDAKRSTTAEHQGRVAALYQAIIDTPSPALDAERGVVLRGFLVTEVEQVTAAGDDGRQVFSDVFLVEAGVSGV